MFEECGLPYKVHPVNILQGEQFDEAYLRLNPNNKVPTIVDPKGPDGEPFTVFESGAILLYLGEKADRFLGGPPGSAARHTVTQWLMFQMASVGPMFGQCGYFRKYARGSDEELRHGRERYSNEAHRIYRVLEKRLGAVPFLAGEDYSVADMAVYPWIQPDMHGIDLQTYPNVLRWYEAIKARPAVQQAYKLLAEDCKVGDRSDSTHKNLFERQKDVGRTNGASSDPPAAPAGSAAAAPDIELWYTPIANHVHAVEAVIAHCQLVGRIRLTPTNPFKVQEDSDPPRPGFATLGRVNPLLTVPTMRVSKEQPLYGGPVIYEFLDSLRPAHVPSLFPEDAAARLEVRRALWLADGLFDQFVRLLLEAEEQPPRPATVERTWTKIVGCLDALEEDAARWREAPLDVAQVRAACALDFIAERPGPVMCAGAGEGWSWRAGRPQLSAWFDRIHGLPPFQAHLKDL